MTRRLKSYFNLQKIPRSQKMGNYYILFSPVFMYSVMLLVCVSLVNHPYHVLAETSRSSSATTTVKSHREIRVIQGYPRRHHQGFNWSSSSITTIGTTSKPGRDEVVNLEDNDADQEKSQVTPYITLGSSNDTASETIVSPYAVDGKWRPVMQDTKKRNLNRTFSLSSKLKSREVTTRRKDITSVLSNYNENAKPSLKSLTPLGRNFSENGGGGDDDEASRKLEVIVPFHPRVTYFSRLFARALAPLFSVVSLWNQKCWSAGFDQGTCYSKKECVLKGGSPRGLCAGGFGVCCVFSYTCGTVAPLNRTYFVNPEFPYSVSKAGTTCEHAITNLEGICQLRLDFEDFHLEGPGPKDGICWQDALNFFGVDIRLPPLCGDLSGHHIYLPVGFDPRVTYSLTLTGERPWRRWKIRTAKIPCGYGSIAPGGCLSNYQSPYGRVTSFNNAADESSGHFNTNIAGLNYGVCVRRERGFCAIRWSKCGHTSINHRDLKRRRRDTANNAFQSSNYLNTIDAEKQKQLKQALTQSFPRNRRSEHVDNVTISESQDGVLTPRSFNLNTWRPMSLFNDNSSKNERKKSRKQVASQSQTSSLVVQQKRGKDQVKVAVSDFLEDLTNALKFNAKHKTKGDGGIGRPAAGVGGVSNNFQLPSVSAKQKAHSSILQTKKPSKLSALKNIFSKGKGKPSWFGGSEKNKKPLNLKRPIFNKKNWSGKNKSKGKWKKTKGKKKKKRKKKKTGCKKVVIPFPLPIAIPFPFGGGGGGAGGGDNGEDGWGWSDDNIVFTTSMEPFLIRIMTDKWKENGLAPVCLEWEQISCDDWYANQHHGF